MQKQGWGVTQNKKLHIDTTAKVQKKNQAFWQAANQNIMVIPDIDAQTQAIHADVSNPLSMQVDKLVDFYDMQIQTRKSTLPSTEQGVDLSLLLSTIRTSQDLQEKDQPWEFAKLKTQIYQLVAKLNRL